MILIYPCLLATGHGPTKIMNYFLSLVALFLIVPRVAFAASAGLSAPMEVQVGHTFQVRMVVGGAKDIDTVRFIGGFPSDMLELQGMANGSALPTRSPGSGISGGAFNFGGFSLGNPVSGGVQAGVLTFKAKKVGKAMIALHNETRILSAGEDQTTGRGGVSVKIIEASAKGEISTIVPAQAVIDLSSTTHPDQNVWSTARAMRLEWKFSGRQPTSYAVGFDQAPEGPAETKLSTDTFASFSAPSDGVWYGHLVVRYSPSEVVRKDYRFLIDATVPRPLAVAVDQTDVRPNTPNFLRFTALDESSGIAHYDVSIQGDFVTSTRLPYLSVSDLGVGEYRANIKAVDYAGNFSEGVASFRLVGSSLVEQNVIKVEKTQDFVLRFVLLVFIVILLFVLGIFIGRQTSKKRRSKKNKS